MNLQQRTVLVDTDIVFPEGPRWYQDRLWFSDMFSGRVLNVDLDGKVEMVTRAEGWVSGLGWLPDGHLLVVSMNDRRLLRLDGDELVEAANLEALTHFVCNDMVVDQQGRAYVGEVGFDVHGGAEFKPASLVMVTADGDCHVVDADMACPNGAVITADGSTLIVAESLADRLTAFDIEPDGSLSNKRVWAEQPGLSPDGICLDAEEGIWVASPIAREVLRIEAGGKVTHRFSTDPMPVACMLGGPDRDLLFVCQGQPPADIVSSLKDAPAPSAAKIDYVKVDIPGVGLP